MKRLWTIHLLSLAAIIVWAASDPLFETVARLQSFDDAALIVGTLRMVGVVVVTIIAAFTLFALLAKQLSRCRSDPRHRSIRQLLAITTVIALWLSLSHHHGSIAWQGKRVRFAMRVHELENIAAPLRTDWPEGDSDLPGIGPFMAYPFGCPKTLVLLQAPRITSQSVYISAIERCAGGAIKLQLTGTDGGDWAEWHPPSSHPSSFTGGLGDPHELCTATAIGHGWYLVRYNDRQNTSTTLSEPTSLATCSATDTAIRGIRSRPHCRSGPVR